ncbi:MAG: hypothetical protein ABJZ55_02090 [Fuerstiella sp.]
MSGRTASSDEREPVRVHLCISGFTQTEQTPNGVFRLYSELCRLGFNNGVSRVLLYRWNSKWAEVAEFLWLLGQEEGNGDCRVEINIYAYSWGMGWGAIQLVNELRRRGITVNIIVSADGVYRHKWFKLPAMARRNAWWAPTIKIPPRVREVTPFHQRQNVPQGHVIKRGKGCSAMIHESRELESDHQYIDDSDDFHLACIHASRRLMEVR